MGVVGYYIVRLNEVEGNCLIEAEWVEKNCSEGGGWEGGSGVLEGGRSGSQSV